MFREEFFGGKGEIKDRKMKPYKNGQQVVKKRGTGDRKDT